MSVQGNLSLICMKTLKWTLSLSFLSLIHNMKFISLLFALELRGGSAAGQQGLGRAAVRGEGQGPHVGGARRHRTGAAGEGRCRRQGDAQGGATAGPR